MEDVDQKQYELAEQELNSANKEIARCCTLNNTKLMEIEMLEGSIFDRGVPPGDMVLMGGKPKPYFRPVNALRTKRNYPVPEQPSSRLMQIRETLAHKNIELHDLWQFSKELDEQGRMLRNWLLSIRRGERGAGTDEKENKEEYEEEEEEEGENGSESSEVTNLSLGSSEEEEEEEEEEEDLDSYNDY